MIWAFIAGLVYAFFVYAYTGFAFAYFQRRYPHVAKSQRVRDLTFSVLISLTPVGWLVILFKAFRPYYGWMPPSLAAPADPGADAAQDQPTKKDPGC